MFTQNLGFNKANLTVFFIAVIIAANPLTWIFKIPNGLALITIISFITIISLNLNQIFSKINVNKLVLILLIYFVFLISLLRTNFNGQTINYLIQFSILGVIPIIISSINIDIKKLLYAVAFIGALFIPFSLTFKLQKYDTQLFENFWGFIMGISYGLLRFINASLILLFLFQNKHKFKFLFILEITAILVFLFLFGTRGAILSILLLGLIIYLQKKSSEFSAKLIFQFVTINVSVLIITCIFFIFIYPKLVVHDINFAFIDKMLSLSEKDDISNGRSELLKIAFRDFLENPLIGNGIGSFDNFSGGYPHNFILHFLFEGGILLGLPIACLIAKAIYIMFSNKYIFDDRLLISFLFFSSVVELFFSSYPWISQIFWYLIGKLISMDKIQDSTKQIVSN